MVEETQIQVQKHPLGLLLSMNLQSGSLSSSFPSIRAQIDIGLQRTISLQQKEPNKYRIGVKIGEYV